MGGLAAGSFGVCGWWWGVVVFAVGVRGSRVGRVVVGGSGRVVVGVVLCVCLLWAGVSVSFADPLSGVGALERAGVLGVPVEVSGLTDERTRVVADPVSGGFRVELSAGVARVSDGVGGWRVPDTSLRLGGDGWW